MQRTTVRVSILAAIAGALVAFPAGASATAFTSPGTLDFKSEPVGVASPPQTTALLVQCTNYIGFPVNSCVTGAIDPLSVDIKTPADYSTTNTCPAVLAPGPLTAPNACTLTVTFKPTKAGPRDGTLSTGTTIGVGPGPTIALKGSGVGQPGQTTKKKCKKKHKSAAQTAKKKCKKR
jgi:hypothetical protein